MAEWRPVGRGKPEIVGVNRQYPGLLDVRVTLDADPPDEWAAFFERPSGVPISLSMHPPTLTGRLISLRPSDSELESYIEHIDLRIDAANRHYETESLPRIRARELREASIQAEERARIEDARRRADSL